LSSLRAIEFFSGMGSFAEACRDTSLQVVAAFDQNELANHVYEHNFGLSPRNSTLDSVQLSQIPEADIWWMSPPCTPYSVRGRRDDLKDPRAKSLIRLMQLFEEKQPQIIVLENVRGFQQSEAKKLVVETLNKNGYQIFEMLMCSTDFGVPMRRPRYFLTGFRSSVIPPPAISIIAESLVVQPGSVVPVAPIKNFIDTNASDELIMDRAEFQKYEAGLNVVSPHELDAICICFTKNYYRCKTASGSLLLMDDGQVRRFSSREILRLFGFSPQYKFPQSATEEQTTALLGNAVDVRMIRHLLEKIVAPSERQPPSYELSSCR
jgi:DNA (cytosine-5)-methyltransferase 1